MFTGRLRKKQKIRAFYGRPVEGLIGITKAVSSIDERNTLIAAACEEQALVAKEIDRSIIRIRDLSIHSAVRSNQTRAASEDLAQIAVDLKRRLDGFTYG